MAVEIIQQTEEMVGKDHLTKSDTLNRAFVIEHANDGTHLSAFGSLYEDTPAGSTTSITTAGTYVKWAHSTEGESDGTLVVVDATDDDMTMGAGSDGVYDAYVSASMAGEAGMEVFLAIFVDGVRQGKLTRKVEFGGAHEHFPDSVDLKIGTLNSGDITTMQSKDATYYDVSEVAELTGTLVDLTFQDVVSPLLIDFAGRYDGSSGDNMECQIYDASVSADEVQNGGNGYTCIRSHTSGASTEPGVGADWTSYWESKGAASGEDAWVTSTAYDDSFDEVRSDTKDLPHSAGTDYTRRWIIPNTHIVRQKYSDSNGDCRIRFIHTTAGNATHNLYIDAISLQDDHSSASVTVSDLLALTATDVVDVRMTTDVDSSQIITTNVNFKLKRIKKS